jgi:hypothetical protein
MIMQPAYCDDLKRWDGYQRKRRKFGVNVGVNVVAPSTRAFSFESLVPLWASRLF